MPVVYVYGFPPKMEFENFQAEFFESFPQFKEFKVDYKMEKIYAFIHTNTQEEAQQIIARWHDQPMRNSGENKLQVRMKQEGQSNNQNNNQHGNFQQRPNFRNNNMGGGNRGPRPNYNNNGGMRPNMRGPRPNFNNSFGGNNNYNNNMNSFNQNNGFMNQNNNFNNNRNNNNRNNNSGNDSNITIGPQKPVLYVYGFPKDMPQEEFEKTFLGETQSSHKQTDYFQEKIYCFVHMLDNESCDTLIDNWDTKPLIANETASGERPKPLQVRYKGLDSKTIAVLNSIQPVLWVYGFPKGLTEDQFKQEFMCGMDAEKIDYFEQKLYCFVHMSNWKQCIKLINKWDGKLMNNSKSPLQVRFKNLNNNNNKNNNNNFGNNNNSFNHHNSMGDMNQQNMYNQFNNHQNQNQFYMNNMQRGNNPHQNNMYQNNRQPYNNGYNNMQNNMQNNQMQFMQNNRMPNNNWGGQPNMMGMQGGFAGDQGGNFRNKGPNNFQNRGHPQQFNQGGMNDGNFRNNQMQFRGSRQ